GQVDREDFHPKRGRCSTNHCPLSQRDGGSAIADDPNPRNLRCDLSEQLEPFGAQAIFELGEPGGVAPGARHAADSSQADRIDRLGHSNGYGTAGNLLERLCRRPNAAHQHVWAESNKFFRILSNAFEISATPAHIDTKVAPDSPSCLLQCLRKCSDASLGLRL